MKLSDFERNDKNPFVEKAIEGIEGGVVRKYKSASNYDQRAVLQAVDPKTGEMLGHTSFIRQIEVDEARFAKIYLSNFSAFFDLKPASIRVFGYIINQVRPGQDYIAFKIKDCQEYTKYKGFSAVYRGLSGLVSAEIIARGWADSIYFVNPLVVFNGNRITFAKSYVKKKSKVDKNQLELPF